MLHVPVQLEDLDELPDSLRKGAHTPAVDSPFEWDMSEETED